MATGKDRVEFEAANVQVSISDIGVKPGDIMVCDDSGVVVVPLERAEEMAVVAKEIDQAERKMFELIEQGMSLREARAQMGYSKLQSRQD